jgi:hypothetical protein
MKTSFLFKIYSTNKTLWNYILVVFLLALILRLFFVWITSFHPLGWVTSDSYMYTEISDGIMNTGEYMHKSENPLRYHQETERVPGYPLYLASIFLFFGRSLIWPLIGQAILGAVTCVVIGLITREFNKNAFLAGGILAALNLNLIAHDALIMAESLFLFFFTLHLYQLLQLLKEPSYWGTFRAGLLLGFAIMIRPVLIYWCPVITLFSSLVFIITHRQRLVHAVACGALLLFGTSLLTTPWYLRNYTNFGSWELVSQKGANMLHWVVPLVKEYNTGLSWSKGNDEMYQALDTEMRRRGMEKLPENPFQQSKLMMEVGFNEFKKFDYWSIIYAWTTGTAINLMTPSMASVNLVNYIERPRFYKTHGRNFALKVRNFLLHPDNSLYLSLMLPSIFFILVGRFFMLFGLIYMLIDKTKLPLAILLFLFSSYILAVTGPIVSAARYRLPLEPILITLTALGLLYLHARWNKRMTTNVKHVSIHQQD